MVPEGKGLEKHWFSLETWWRLSSEDEEKFTHKGRREESWKGEGTDKQNRALAEVSQTGIFMESNGKVLKVFKQENEMLRFSF